MGEGCVRIMHVARQLWLSLPFSSDRLPGPPKFAQRYQTELIQIKFRSVGLRRSIDLHWSCTPKILPYILRTTMVHYPHEIPHWCLCRDFEQNADSYSSPNHSPFLLLTDALLWGYSVISWNTLTINRKERGTYQHRVLRLATFQYFHTTHNALAEIASNRAEIFVFHLDRVYQQLRSIPRYLGRWCLLVLRHSVCSWLYYQLNIANNIAPYYLDSQSPVCDEWQMRMV